MGYSVIRHTAMGELEKEEDAGEGGGREAILIFNTYIVVYLLCRLRQNIHSIALLTIHLCRRTLKIFLPPPPPHTHKRKEAPIKFSIMGHVSIYMLTYMCAYTRGVWRQGGREGDTRAQTHADTCTCNT